MALETIIVLIGITASIAGIIFGYLSYIKAEKKAIKSNGKVEGEMLVDILYIKESLKRLEKNHMITDERYLHISERLTRLEESLANVKKTL